MCVPFLVTALSDQIGTRLAVTDQHELDVHPCLGLTERWRLKVTKLDWPPMTPTLAHYDGLRSNYDTRNRFLFRR